MRYIKRGALIVIMLIIALVAVMLIRTAQLRELDIQPWALPDSGFTGDAKAQARLSHAIQFKTISNQDPAQFDQTTFRAFNTWLAQQYPLTYQRLTLQRFNEYTLLFTWPGSNSALKPVVFLAHYDVVPAQGKGWLQPPFAGVIADGYIWGRGAFDDKGSVIGILEATEHLLQQGHQPTRTLMLAFGHDEEIGGDGAKAIVAHMKQRGIHAEFVVDEGGQLTQGLIKGVSRPVANINGAEKGYATYRLTATDNGGHSSIPTYSTTVTHLATAIHKIHTQRLPPRLTPPVSDMLTATGQALPFTQRLAVANQWALEGLMLQAFAKKDSTRAMTTTTVAPTIIHAGTKENVLPKTADALVNFRLLPGESRASLMAYLTALVDNPKISITLEPFSSDPSPYSGATGRGWAVLAGVTKHHFPDAIITPGMTVGATDARHYADVSDAQYRFQPLLLLPADIGGFHGLNERISIENWRIMIRWYIDALKASSSEKATL